MATGAKSRPARPDRPAYRCAECGWTAAKWVGRCGECQAWGSIAQVDEAPVGVTRIRSVSTPACPIAEVDAESAAMWQTGVDELDRVLGGGIVSGAVVLLAGEPGVGKSTLLLDVASRAAAGSRTVLYVTGEESAAQVRLRAERIGALRPRLLLAAETDLSTVLGHVEATAPDLLVVDSVQTIVSDAVEGSAGNVGQVREVAASLIRVAKSRSMATVLVGHVTKDGSIAGPRVLEHLVDVVCQFEGDRHSRLRMVRAVKNRYGPTDEVGCFDLSDTGIAGLADPSGLFLSRHAEPVPGTCVTVTLEGRRPLLAEVQALVAPSALSNPRRATSGLEASRVAMVLAVLERRAGTALAGRDTYVATVGGARLAEPSTDLAIALAVAGAALDRPMPQGVIAIGEVGLAGEVRPVTGIGRRLAEAARLGYRRAIIPAGSDDPAPEGMVVLEAGDIHSALRHATLLPGGPARPPAPVLPAPVLPAPRARTRAERRGGEAARPRSVVRRRTAGPAYTLLGHRRHPGARDHSPLRSTRQVRTQVRPNNVQGVKVAHERSAEEQLRATLAAVAPGTELRDGLERILRGRTGALIVLGFDKTVEDICTGGFSLDVEFSATRLRELAKMDGAIVTDRDVTELLRAAVQLLPDATIETSESGTRHRTAERVAKQAGFPVISVSQSMRIVALYVGGLRYVLEGSDAILAKANQALATLERYKARLDEVTGTLSALEIEDLVTVRDVSIVVQRLEMVRRISEEIADYVVELGTDGRLLSLQLDELIGGVSPDRELVIRDYLDSARRERSMVDVLVDIAAIPSPELVDLSTVARMLGFSTGGDALDVAVSPKGYRLLNKVPRLPGAIVERLVDHFGDLQKLLAANLDDLMTVDGVGEQRARAVREGLSRLAESSILERYV